MVELLNIYGDHVRYIGEREARQILDREEAKVPDWAGGWRNRRDIALTVIQLRNPMLSKNDPATITKSEMEINASGAAFGGRRINKRHPDHLGNRIDAVMTKIEEWPFIGDTKAIRVCPVAIPA